MKHIVILMMLFASCFASAQDNITQELGDFHEVKVFDGVSVTIIKADKNRAIISGKDSDQVVIVNKNGKLKIRMKISQVFDGYKTFVALYSKDILDVLDVNENASISSKETIAQVDIEVNSQEGGEINIDLDVERLEANATTGGNIKLNGTAKNQEVAVNTGGKFKGEGLVTEQTNVVVKAGGTANVNATEYMNAKVKVGGTINVYGNPKVLEKQTFVGGTINEH
ncbi:head GIN domain-containing protein [Galbibacter pacificus]|uniref:DUF2807 domain-containing protein n=1 Tax=Galbibacter pacificus TaxID=2996052 RepID=A0ABT6FS67_9FLAO|nr:head GIN domain-containing protein [Galbibacter pacificus]MDG3582987.1 DUF2807 domain-containing protein [Galbibacter pacificus]MDG3585894.1 DUF2807 domain-containing protein [Galbibacter pacificus]